MESAIRADGAGASVFECRGLSYQYPEPGSDGTLESTPPTGSCESLIGIDLEISEGEFVVLAGLSGSGKSTLLRVACGLIPHFHGGRVSGEVEVAGYDLRETGPAELASRVGLVSQDPETQVVSTTVRAELRLPLELRGVEENATARAVEETALALGIEGLLQRQTSTLSGGELQRVALGAAMVTRPALLLLDEATSQLDPVAADGLIWTLRRINEEFGVTVVCCEHRLERCLDGADRAIGMQSGSIAFDGSPDGFCEWALEDEPALATSPARALRALGSPVTASRRKARRMLSEVTADWSGAIRGSSVEDTEPAAPGGGKALDFRRISVKLASGEESTEALDRVSLELGPGERVALLGANGAGKTTLLRVAAGLAEPSGGTVIAGEGAVAMLPQRPFDLIIRDRIGEELPGQAGMAALELVGLSGFEDRDPRDLSGGERQRLAIALVLAGRSQPDEGLPSALLFDEPTRGMDRERKEDLASFFIEAAGRGSAVMVATHDLEFAAGFAERAVLLSNGRVIADGPIRELVADGLHFSTELSRLTDGRLLRAEDLTAGESALQGPRPERTR